MTGKDKKCHNTHSYSWEHDKEGRKILRFVNYHILKYYCVPPNRAHQCRDWTGFHIAQVIKQIDCEER